MNTLIMFQTRFNSSFCRSNLGRQVVSLALSQGQTMRQGKARRFDHFAPPRRALRRRRAAAPGGLMPRRTVPD